mgnify:CR=1 FL=1
MTELTEDEFYDNGNIAKNIAALLGIDPDRIKIVDVIRETSEERRIRRERTGMKFRSNGRFLGRTDANATSLQFEVISQNATVSNEDATSTDEGRVENAIFRIRQNIQILEKIHIFEIFERRTSYDLKP